jgi:hypothetical protein
MQINLDLQLRNKKYENKLKYYKKYYNSNKINKYLYKLNIKPFQTILNDMKGGSSWEDLFLTPIKKPDATKPMLAPTRNTKTSKRRDEYRLIYDGNEYIFVFTKQLFGGKSGPVELYYLQESPDPSNVPPGFYIKKKVSNEIEYINEKMILLNYNTGFDNIKCRLKMYKDKKSDGGILIYQYLGIDLHNLNKVFLLDKSTIKEIMNNIIDEMQQSFKNNDTYIVHVDIKPANICIKFEGNRQFVYVGDSIYLFDETTGIDISSTMDDQQEKIDELIRSGFKAYLIDYGNYISNHNKVKNTLLSSFPSILTGICEVRMSDITNNYIFIIAQYWSLLVTMLVMLSDNTAYNILPDSIANFISNIKTMPELLHGILNISQERFLDIVTNMFNTWIDAQLASEYIDKKKLKEFAMFMLKNHYCYENEIKIREYNLDIVKDKINMLLAS